MYCLAVPYTDYNPYEMEMGKEQIPTTFEKIQQQNVYIDTVMKRISLQDFLINIGFTFSRTLRKLIERVH